MIVIPAVDIRQGRCVRLLQGRADAETVYGDDPAAMALSWQEQGAERIHVVDLDGAFEKSPKNKDAVESILKAVSVPIQVGGGIRNRETLDMWISLGVDRVIVGTEAVRHPAWVREAACDHPGRVVVGIDARDGKVAVEGWTETTSFAATELARMFEDCPLAAFHFTDIHRDGMQSGVNIEETRALARSTKIPVVASGGVSVLEDIVKLLPLEADGVVGVITGKALYAGTLDLHEALAAARGETPV